MCCLFSRANLFLSSPYKFLTALFVTINLYQLPYLGFMRFLVTIQWKLSKMPRKTQSTPHPLFLGPQCGSKFYGNSRRKKKLQVAVILMSVSSDCPETSRSKCNRLRPSFFHVRVGCSLNFFISPCIPTFPQFFPITGY